MRKQAALTLRCMQALVRVQARMRARRVRLTTEGQAVQQMLENRRNQVDLLKVAVVYTLRHLPLFLLIAAFFSFHFVITFCFGDCLLYFTFE